MTDKRTPGPWQACEGVIEGDWFICCPVGPGNTGYVAKTAATNEKAKEDAHLIAASPELLAALEWAVSKLDCKPSGWFSSDDTKAHEAAIAVLDKARGRE